MCRRQDHIGVNQRRTAKKIGSLADRIGPGTDKELIITQGSDRFAIDNQISLRIIMRRCSTSCVVLSIHRCNREIHGDNQRRQQLYPKNVHVTASISLPIDCRDGTFRMVNGRAPHQNRLWNVGETVLERMDAMKHIPCHRGAQRHPQCCCRVWKINRKGSTVASR
jgi:hypothetical protein